MIDNIEVAACQICGNIKALKYMSICTLCGRHICDDCTRYSYHEQMQTDHPEPYCRICWYIGKPYRIQIDEIELEANIKREHLIFDWYNAVINNNKIQEV